MAAVVGPSNACAIVRGRDGRYQSLDHYIPGTGVFPYFFPAGDPKCPLRHPQRPAAVSKRRNLDLRALRRPSHAGKRRAMKHLARRSERDAFVDAPITTTPPPTSAAEAPAEVRISPTFDPSDGLCPPELPDGWPLDAFPWQDEGTFSSDSTAPSSPAAVPGSNDADLLGWVSAHFL